MRTTSLFQVNQAAGDRKILAERLGISAEQLAYVTNSEPGHGLLFFNNGMFSISGEESRSLGFWVAPVGTPPHFLNRFQISAE